MLSSKVVGGALGRGTMSSEVFGDLRAWRVPRHGRGREKGHEKQPAPAILMVQEEKKWSFGGSHDAAFLMLPVCSLPRKTSLAPPTLCGGTLHDNLYCSFGGAGYFAVAERMLDRFGIAPGHVF